MAATVWSSETPFTATGGTETVVRLNVPHRGFIRGYSLSQVTGATAGATAALYTSKQDKAPNSNLPAEAFHILDIALSSGAAKTDNHDMEVAYVNRDGTPTLQQRYLYLKITPAGTGEKQFVLALTIEPTQAR